MKSAIAASTLIVLAAAKPQGGPPHMGPHMGPPHGGPPGGIGPFAAFPTCADSCWADIASQCSSISDYNCLCGSSAISKANSCVSSNCNSNDADEVYKAVDQLCANAGVQVKASPEATWSATSGGNAWPSGWTTAASWPSGGPWGSGGGPAGWNPNNGWGPFGQGRPGNGWGAWASHGAWTKGPWTSWWGTDACPPSTWSGWTSGTWSANAPWTTWAGCTAKTTSTGVVTSTITANGTTVTTTKTQFGIHVAQATNGGGSGSGSGASTSTSPGAAAQITGGWKMAGSVAGAAGVVAGALML